MSGHHQLVHTNGPLFAARIQAYRQRSKGPSRSSIPCHSQETKDEKSKSCFSNGYQVTVTNGTAILVEPVVGRDANPSSLPSITVPANGATTTEDISIKL